MMWFETKHYKSIKLHVASSVAWKSRHDHKSPATTLNTFTFGLPSFSNRSNRLRNEYIFHKSSRFLFRWWMFSSARSKFFFNGAFSDKYVIEAVFCIGWNETPFVDLDFSISWKFNHLFRNSVDIILIHQKISELFIWYNRLLILN